MSVLMIRIQYFNSQPHKEADGYCCHIGHRRFISTHSLTRRLTSRRRYGTLRTYYFNSQPHKEADMRTSAREIRQRHFNSQPHKEADWVIVCLEHQISYFNSQPHKEADRKCCNRLDRYRISTHSLTRRLTDYDVSFDKMEIISTHSLTRRLTNTWQNAHEEPEYFNSQPHKEADSRKHFRV